MEWLLREEDAELYEKNALHVVVDQPAKNDLCHQEDHNALATECNNMKCNKPYMYKGVIPFGCGQCMSCRKNRRRLWQHRLMLESMKHEKSCFVTLTYADEHLPKDGSLNPKDLQDFLKRLRRAIEPFKIRYYAVGEYGETTFRPHYHIALFGISRDSHDLIHNAWGLGLIDSGRDNINKDSAQYICGYVTKKMTKKDDPRLNGKHPEFARMSLKPGIGAGIVDDLVNVLTTSNGCEYILRNSDVPMSLNHGENKSWPLGRYIRRLLRERLGFPETGAQEGWEEQCKIRAQEEMLQLCIQNGYITQIAQEEKIDIIKQLYKHDTAKMILVETNESYNKQLELKESLDKQRGRRI